VICQMRMTGKHMTRNKTEFRESFLVLWTIGLLFPLNMQVTINGQRRRSQVKKRHLPVKVIGAGIGQSHVSCYGSGYPDGNEHSYSQI
jgi:hypothetical protein